MIEVRGYKQKRMIDWWINHHIIFQVNLHIIIGFEYVLENL